MRVPDAAVPGGRDSDRHPALNARGSPGWSMGHSDLQSPVSNPIFRTTQRGWIGLIVILVALAIVAWLARDALVQYGLVAGTAAPRPQPAERSSISPAGLAPVDATSAVPAPGAPLERARAVESMLQQQSGERASRMERAAP